MVITLSILRVIFTISLLKIKNGYENTQNNRILDFGQRIMTTKQTAKVIR